MPTIPVNNANTQSIPVASGTTGTIGAISAESVITEVESLFALPDAAIQLSALLSDPDTTNIQIVDIISIDPALSARVLKLVNSAYFGLNESVGTISRAVAVLGRSPLHSLVLATSAGLAFENMSSELVDMEKFWKRSVYAALAAGSLASRGGPRLRERVFLAALLHQVGQLVMYHHLPEISNQVLAAVARGEDRASSEYALLGFTHADLGATLLEHWKLPVALTEPVRYQERSSAAPDHAREAAIVHLASLIAQHMELNLANTETASKFDVDAELWAQANCNPEILDSVIEEVDLNWFQVISLIAPNAMLIY
ncbi:HDOD domain-containing protein [Undibacterium sp.]|uniref:HDOD domain-containing protein n=1 Tax=Undibacterium sp. TaxID=1914977 RepID=UPI0025CF917D|nr:HDOD domain-containing protein [Undibacterium sp.]